MGKEGALPEILDLSDPKIDDPQERARIMRAFESRLSAPAGYVLPVQRWTARASGGWLSEVWETRRGRLFLQPGDSPIGFRLPIGSLPQLAPVDYPNTIPAEPVAERAPLGDVRLAVMQWADRGGHGAGRSRPLEVRVPQVAPHTAAAPGSAASAPVRTAMAIEVRDGRLCVFMPPV